MPWKSYSTNIIISGDDYCVLDWNHASQGNASADIARTYIWFKINMPEYAELYLDSFCNMTEQLNVM